MNRRDLFKLIAGVAVAAYTGATAPVRRLYRVRVRHSYDAEAWRGTFGTTENREELWFLKSPGDDNDQTWQT